MRSSFVALSLVALFCSVAVIDTRPTEEQGIFDDVVHQTQNAFDTWVREAYSVKQQLLKESEPFLTEAFAKIHADVQEQVNKGRKQVDDVNPQILDSIIKRARKIQEGLIDYVKENEQKVEYARLYLKLALGGLKQYRGRENKVLSNIDAKMEKLIREEVIKSFVEIKQQSVTTEPSVRAKRSILDDIVKAISGDEATRKYLTDKVEELKKQVDSLVKQGADNFSSAKDQALEQAKKQLENFENELKENAPKFQQDAQKALESFGQQVNSAGSQAQEAVKNFFDNLQKQIPQQQ